MANSNTDLMKPWSRHWTKTKDRKFDSGTIKIRCIRCMMWSDVNWVWPRWWSDRAGRLDLVTVSWLEPLQSPLGKSWNWTKQRGGAAGHELTASYTAKGKWEYSRGQQKERTGETLDFMSQEQQWITTIHTSLHSQVSYIAVNVLCSSE